MRSALFWIHLAVGVTTGVVVLVMSATGTLLAFQRQILDWSASRHVAAPVGAERLPLDSVVAIARSAVPADQSITSVTVWRSAEAPVIFGLAARRYAYVDPYTGAVLPPNAALQRFFFEVERWHRAMALGDGLRGRPGVTITGAANLGFLFLIVSGVVLWVPRRFSWRAFRAVLLPERGLRGRRRDWNWHHAFGIWVAPVLFLLVLSGAFISYQWPMALLGRVLGEQPVAEGPTPRRGTAPGAPGAPAGRVASDVEQVEPAPAPRFDEIAAQAAAAVPNWYSIQIRMPRDGGSTVAATISTTSWVRPDARTSLSVDTHSGTARIEPGYAAFSTARKLRSWVRGVHTGEAVGPVGQLVAALASLAAVLLAWTGIALAWRRMLRSLARA